ncbi:Predicted ATPase [Friedmanniella luteola]|uniref:Predicted ATPase n=1 Tax=Friedmanniella luteola TaxID=546871 RepID=A0A1H1ZJQ1_9ACTN|nr:helix-turn-helix domain-containing protein [Friedmanniella luteola]SDT34051.1 Predicted ATPase [Friedmanniella luteola]
MLHEADGAAAPFAHRLRALRERVGLTQEELASRAGLTSHAVSALERGARTRPYPHTVRALATALELDGAEQAALIASLPSRRAPAATQPTPAPATPERRPTSSAPTPPPGVVVPPTPLHGRDGDLAALTSLVRSGRVRLVTLTGMGGVGKTRLAVALAAALADDFPDGVVQVALASVASPAAVLDTLGRALGLSGADGPDAVELVAAHLGRRCVLVLLDNLEHLVDAAADLGRLVALCPAVTVLVSSRAPLRVRGEHEYPVGPLALPSPDALTEQELAASPAGALVLDQVRAVAPGLELTPDRVQALATLCARLSGIPLALELATARLRLLTPRALLERLDSVLDSSSGARDLPERQRTMRATLDWSHGLLTPAQQLLFTVLSVFRGGATLDAVEQVVVASTALSAADVVEQLEVLVEQSMVVLRTGEDGRRRYTMLEPVAQYAQALLDGPLAQSASRAHAEVYRALARQAASGYEGADQVLWLARTEAEEPNLLVAVERGLTGGDPDTSGGIVWELWLYWWLRGQFRRGREQAERCLPAALTPAVLARVTLSAATMAYAGGDMPASARYWAEALRLGEELQDPEVVCKALAGTGLAALAVGDLTVAADRFRRALPACAEAGEPGIWMSSLTHVWLGTVVLLQGDPVGAEAQVHEGLEIARRRGDRLSTYVALYNLSQAALAAHEYRRARAYLEEGIVLSEQTVDLANLAYFLDSLAVVESVDGRHDRVPVLLGAARGFRDVVGGVYAYYVPDASLGAAAERQARAVLGAAAYDEAFDRGRDLDVTAAVRVALA